MKKIFALTVALLMIASAAAFAAPETVDLAAMTRMELRGLIDRARAELLKYEVFTDGDTVVFNEKGIKITFKSYSVIEKKDGTTQMELVYIIENNSDIDIIMAGEEMYINGWKASCPIYSKVKAGKKSLETEKFFNMEKVQVTSQEDLKDMEFIIELADPKSYKILYRSDVININF